MRFFSFFLLEGVMAVIALGFGYAGRKLLGRFVTGPLVAVWGAVLGLLGMVLGGMVFALVWSDLGFINLQGDIWTGARVFLINYWDTGLIGGVLGALVASLTSLRRKPPVAPPSQTP